MNLTIIIGFVLFTSCREFSHYPFYISVQQSSFYGLTSMLPARYTQAVMTGESVAGLLVSINRILTKLFVPSKRNSTMLFFTISIGIILICIITYVKVQCTGFVKFYSDIVQQQQKLVLNPSEQVRQATYQLIVLCVICV